MSRRAHEGAPPSFTDVEIFSELVSRNRELRGKPLLLTCHLIDILGMVVSFTNGLSEITVFGCGRSENYCVMKDFIDVLRNFRTEQKCGLRYDVCPLWAGLRRTQPLTRSGFHLRHEGRHTGAIGVLG